MDLFDEKSKEAKEPLAARMRPRNLDEFIGQDHIVGKGRLLRRAIAADQLTSVIFYGPPGTGKTTLARVIANHTKSNFITLNAVLTGVAHIRESIAQAEEKLKLYERRTILFVDEVHRWNKAQQDALLPWVENGTFILVGATTENPFFEVNKALVSRSRVFQLKALEAADLQKAATNALKDVERGYGKWNIQFEEGSLEHLIDTASGDARSLLNALELAVETTPDTWPPIEGETIYISQETAEESIQRKVVLYDRDGDYHYDIISAFIKSLRGRDPDAAMYWLARMVAAGEDPAYIFRRMIISACEDTGLADPHAISVVESCAASFDRVGLPEGRYHLAHAALYLATAPKSNSSMAFFDALSAVQKEDTEVPNHLRDASRDAEGFGHGKGYMYPHAYRDHWVAQQYLPNALTGRVFYTPSSQGYEKSIQDEVLQRRELQIASILEQQETDDASLFASVENLTFSPLTKGREHWQKRTEANRSESLLKIRDTLLDGAHLVRHSRALVFNADDGLLLWETLRRTPEGITCGVCNSKNGAKVLSQYAQTLPEIEQPFIVSIPEGASRVCFSFEPLDFADTQFGETLFDTVLFKDPIVYKKDIDSFVKSCSGLKDSGIIVESASFHIAQRNLRSSQRLSQFLEIHTRGTSFSPALLHSYKEAEETFYADTSNELFAWSITNVADSFEKAGFKAKVRELEIEELQLITPADIERWFDANSAYGSFMQKELGLDSYEQIKKAFLAMPPHGKTYNKKTVYAFYRIFIEK